MHWHQLLINVFWVFESFAIAYVGTINAIYFLFTILGYFALRQYPGRLKPAEGLALLKSPLVPALSLLAPAHNESLTIRESVRAMLKLNYPDHEVIVINDGSTDDTFRILIEEFRLYKSGRVSLGTLRTRPIKGIYESRDPIRLVVVDKPNSGKADSLNAGLNVARSPLVAVVDSDSLIEPGALLQLAKPFLEDPDRTLASGGIVRVVNGCDVEHDQVTRVRVPSSLLPRFQAVEYLRAFLGGRIAFSFLNSLLVISGAFGLFRRDVLLAAGGFYTRTVGEDMELVVRLHRLWREWKKDYRVIFVPEPVCWTEVPEQWKTLRRQRNRWQRGAVESLWLHKRMLFNPKFGALGLITFPYFVLFEMLGPAVELAGYVFTGVGLGLHIISPEIALLFFVVSVLFGILLSASAVLLEEFTTRRYPSPGDVGRLLAAAVVENLGIHQLLIVWRTQGLIDGLRGKKGWGAMERRGFQAKGQVRAA